MWILDAVVKISGVVARGWTYKVNTLTSKSVSEQKKDRVKYDQNHTFAYTHEDLYMVGGN